MGVFSNVGVSISVQDTLPKGRGFLDTITDKISGWTHTTAAIGGYLNASASINASREVIDEWLEAGLGRWITLYDEGGNICWRGYVDEISANLAGLAVKRGPLSVITNRLHVVYSAADTSTTPPTMGVRTPTPTTNDTASQALYGIWEKVLSSSGSTLVDATQNQAMYLQEHAAPETVKTLTIGGGNVNMSLTLKGANNWLGYTSNFTTAGTVNLSARIIAILALDPNGLFSTDTSHITTNAYQVTGYANDDAPAQKYITALLTLGDATYHRYTAGFYGEEVFYYQAIPTTLDYLYSLSDTAQEVTTPAGTVVRPWNVLPARWLNFSDLMVGHLAEADWREDPRNLFIEQVTYTAPYGLQVNGQKLSTLAQRLAQLGLSGIGG